MLRPPSAAHPPSFLVTLLGLSMAALLATGCAQQQRQGYYDPPPASTITDAQAQFQEASGRSAVRPPSQIQFELKPPVQQRPVSQQAAAAPVGPEGSAAAGTAAASQAAATPAAVAQPAGEPGGSRQSTDPAAPPSFDATPPTVAAAAASAPAPQAATSTLLPQAQTFLGTLPCFQPDMRCTAQRITLTLAPNGRWRARSAYLESDKPGESAQTDQGCWRSIDERPPRVILLAANGSVRAELVMAANNVLRLRTVNGQSPNLNYSLTRQPDLDPIEELSKRQAPNCQ